MPLLDVRSGSDFTGGGEGWILLALEFDSLAACDGCGRGCLRNSLGPASIPTKSTTTAITGSTYRRLDFDVCASPEKIAVGLRLPAESSGFADRGPGSAAQCQQNAVGQYWVETISPFQPERAGLMPRPWLRQATTRLKPEKRFPSRFPARRRLSSVPVHPARQQRRLRRMKS